MNWRKIRRRISLTLLLGLAAFLIVTWFVGNSLIAPVNHRVPPPEDLQALTTTLRSESGSSLATWYLPAENPRATIVLLHPIRGSRRSMLGRARLFHDAGYAVVMIDFQAHGESPGDRITVGYLEKHDARAAVDYAHQMDPTHPVGIDAWSLGAAATILASPLDIDAAVLESAYPTIADAIHDRVAIRVGPLSYILSPVLLAGLELRCSISPSDLRPVDHIASLGCPVLLLAGDADRHTTIAETKCLFEAAGEPKKLVVFSGASHDDFLSRDPKRFESEVLPFFAEHLATPRSQRKLSAPADRDGSN